MSARQPRGSASSLLDHSCKVDKFYASHVITPLQEACPPATLLLAGRSITICNGSISIPQHHMLLVEGNNIEFKDIHILGCAVDIADSKVSLPLLFVSHAKVTLTRVLVAQHKAGHGIGVGDQGSLQLFDCEIEGHRTCGLVVRGENANVVAHSTCIRRNGQDGVSISVGGSGNFHNCSFQSNLMLGIIASGQGTIVSAWQCVAQSNIDHGFVAHQGALLQLNECNTVSNNIGVLVLGAQASAEWQGGSMSACGTGVMVSNGAKVPCLFSCMVSFYCPLHLDLYYALGLALQGLTMPSVYSFSVLGKKKRNPDVYKPLDITSMFREAGRTYSSISINTI
jgi:hypothetical protein